MVATPCFDRPRWGVSLEPPMNSFVFVITAEEPNPWFRFDLGDVYDILALVLVNRDPDGCTHSCG